MKKLLRLCLVAVLMLFTFLLVGCGGDKFSGKWMSNQAGSLDYYMLNISKNGDGYLVQVGQGGIKVEPKVKNLAEYQKAVQDFNAAGRFNKLGINMADVKAMDQRLAEASKKVVLPIADITLSWNDGFNNNKLSATAKDNVLTVGAGFIQFPITYDEKNKKLLFEGREYVKFEDSDRKKYMQDLKKQYESEKEESNKKAVKELEEFKEKHQQRLNKKTDRFGRYSIEDSFPIPLPKLSIIEKIEVKE